MSARRHDRTRVTAAFADVATGWNGPGAGLQSNDHEGTPRTAGCAVSVAGAFAVVRDWYDRVTLASLYLPTGSFGGGARSLYRLTNLVATGDRLIIELEGQLLLIITEPGEPLADRDHLVFDRFGQLVFDWQEFGNKQPHVEVFHEGELRFVAQGAGL